MKKRKKFFVNFIKIQNLNMGPSFLLVTLVIAGALSSSWPVHPAVCWSAESGRGGDDCLHRHNPHPGVPPNISTYTGEPVFVRQVKNGKLYLGGSGNDTFHIVHLWSSRYKKKQRKKERMLSFFFFCFCFWFSFFFSLVCSNSTDDLYTMGYAYGQLLPKEFQTMFTRISIWLAEMLELAVPWLPKPLAELIAEKGGRFVLDLFKDLVKKHIPKKYYQEWLGKTFVLFVLCVFVFEFFFLKVLRLDVGAWVESARWMILPAFLFLLNCQRLHAPLSLPTRRPHLEARLCIFVVWTLMPLAMLRTLQP